MTGFDEFVEGDHHMHGFMFVFVVEDVDLLEEALAEELLEEVDADTGGEEGDNEDDAEDVVEVYLKHVGEECY